MYEFFSITDEEKRIRQPSGRNILIINRAGWALKYLKEAQLIESKTRGVYNITPRGLKTLKESPDGISLDDLIKFDEFKNFKKRSKNDIPMDSGKEVRNTIDLTPDDMIELGYQNIRSTLGTELLEKIMRNEPPFFEKIVLDLLTAMGYGEGEVIGRPGDGGIDGYINQDKLGINKILFQAKRYSNNVPSSEIKEFISSLDIKGETKGVFITTANLPRDLDKILGKSNKKITFVDGNKLVNLMIDYNIGVGINKIYEIKDIDIDYFPE